jgi:hypothetical protein
VYKRLLRKLLARPNKPAVALMQVDCMINGRRRDHGAERAALEVRRGGTRPLPLDSSSAAPHVS